MIREIINSYSICLHQVRRLTADLSDAQMVHQSQPNINHAAWTVGHLVYSAQTIAVELGLNTWLSPDWLELFATGTTPRPVAGMYPKKDELLEALEDARRRLVRRMAVMKDNDLMRPMGDRRYHGIFPSLGHAVLHVLTVHPSIHLGQLTVWRRSLGLSSSDVEDASEAATTV